MKIFLKYYLPAIVWAIAIFYFSTIPGTGNYLGTAKQVITRKGAHFIEFSILAFLLWRIFYLERKMSLRKAYFFSFILSAFYGVSDEWHQTFVFGRTGRPIDSIFNVVSVIFFLELILIYARQKIYPPTKNSFCSVMNKSDKSFGVGVNWKNISVLFFSILILIGLELKMIVDTQLKTQKNTEIIQNDTKLKTQNDTPARNSAQRNSDAGGEIIQDNTEIKIPEKIMLQVPFTSQAPFKKWDEIHEEACEEASLIMLKYFLEGKKLTPEIAEREIQNLVKFQNEKFGDFKDTTAQETVDLFAGFYGEIKNGKKLKVVYDFPKTDLKKYLARGFPIIVPAAGRELGNPNFTSPGPLYHNLVLVGYAGDTIITNDPGTRKGEGYKYNIDILYNAIHDFPGNPSDIEQGQKAMIVVE